jgi:hypothetical protein
MIVTIVKFVLCDTFACKRACGGYLSFGKRQTYHTGNTINLSLTYLPTKPFDLALLLDISADWRWTRDPIDEPKTWWRSSSRARHDDVIGCPRRWTDGEKFPTGVSPKLGRKSNFDEMVMVAYGFELSWRRPAVVWTVTALLRGYRGDESMVDGLKC